MGAAGESWEPEGTPPHPFFLDGFVPLVRLLEAAGTSSMFPRMPRRSERRRAFTLTEAMVGLAVLGLAGTTLLLAMHGSMRAVHSAEERLVAMGMAQQLLDEIAAQQYMNPGASPYQWPLGPSSSEAAAGRHVYNDLDDYAGYKGMPPQDRWGVPLGQDDGGGGRRHPAFRLPEGHFDTWQQLVSVYYVSNHDLSQALTAGATSNYRAVRVRIVREDTQLGTVTLADVTRVFTYVPSP